MKTHATLLAALFLTTPSLADGWVDNVNGVTLDAAGKVVRFTGLTITTDGNSTAKGRRCSPD